MEFRKESTLASEPVEDEGTLLLHFDRLNEQVYAKIPTQTPSLSKGADRISIHIDELSKRAATSNPNPAPEPVEGSPY